MLSILNLGLQIALKVDLQMWRDNRSICLFTVAKLKIVKLDYLNISTAVDVSKIL